MRARFDLPSGRIPAFVIARNMDIEAPEQAVAVSPDNIPLVLLLANAYMESFAIDDAVAKFEHVIKLDPKIASEDLPDNSSAWA